MRETIRTTRRWTEMGDDAAREDWNLGHRDALTVEDVRSALLGHFDVDLNDPEITEPNDDAKDAALTASVDGYVHEYRRLGGIVATPVIWLAIGNVAEHSGFVTSRSADDGWTPENESGWTYQEVCGSHGTVLHEGDGEDDARKILDAWLVCDAPERGIYCYTHNPHADR